jgi:four helix bundle protein
VSEHYSYRNLILWQRAQDLAFEIIQFAKRLPNTWASAIIARQIIASATPVAANIAEGHGRFSIGAYRNHLSIARGSVAETDSRLNLMQREGWLSIEEEKLLHQRCLQITGMITSKIKQLDEQSRNDGRTLYEDTALYETNKQLLMDETDYQTEEYLE